MTVGCREIQPLCLLGLQGQRPSQVCFLSCYLSCHQNVLIYPLNYYLRQQYWVGVVMGLHTKTELGLWDTGWEWGVWSDWGRDGGIGEQEFSFIKIFMLAVTGGLTMIGFEWDKVAEQWLFWGLGMGDGGKEGGGRGNREKVFSL